MTIRLRNLYQNIFRQDRPESPAAKPIPRPAQPRQAAVRSLEIAPNDPIIAYFQRAPNPVEVDKLKLDSPTLSALKAAGVKMAVPLVSQGELIGVLNLGPRLSEQEYSTDDFALLNTLATQAGPAVRIAQLVRRLQDAAQDRERIEHEMRVARLIQQTLLPKQVPALPGWQIAAYYQPAQAVGGDFYDFIQLPDGRLGLVIGDVTDKGVPAALVMATTRAILRGAAQRLSSPGEVLERVNELLCPDIPPKMFVTSLYAVLDSKTGQLQYANAGHNLPYQRGDGGVVELHATGMPLGCMPGMRYEEKEVALGPGESILFYSDGLVEAHNSRREMFGFPRLGTLIAKHAEQNGTALIDSLLGELSAFCGPDWEQEDDVTLLTLERYASSDTPLVSPLSESEREKGGEVWRTLAEFAVPSEVGNERLAMNRVADAVQEMGLSSARLERLKTAVAEATLNAMEHGNKYRAELLVTIRVRASKRVLSVSVIDQGGGRAIPSPKTPDLEAKLAGLQSPRGWGLFLIKNLVDEMHVKSDDNHHTVELILNLGGDRHVDQTV